MNPTNKANKSVILIVTSIVIMCLLATAILPDLYVNLTKANAINNLRASTGSVTTPSLNTATITSNFRSDKLYFDKTGPVPTNKIWSGVIFGGELAGLYTFPFGSKLDKGKLNIAIPKKFVYEKLVTAQVFAENIAIETAKPIESVYVKDYSDLSVTLRFVDSLGADQYTATFIQGSPYIYIFPTASELKLSGANYKLAKQNGNYFYKADTGGIAVFTDGKISEQSDALTIDFGDGNVGADIAPNGSRKDRYLTLAAFAVPNNDASLNDVLEFAKSFSQNFITSVNSQYQINAGKITISYKFEYGSNETTQSIFGLLPHQYQDQGKFNSPKYVINTIRGNQKFFRVDEEVAYDIERLPLVAELPTKMTAETKERITRLLERDLRETVFVRSSAYFGGNDLLKLAKMLQLANKIGNTALQQNLTQKLTQEFQDWFTYTSTKTGKYFSFDKTVGSITGYETSGFGGENYNDHHFQHGYFIHAAAILAQFNPEFVNLYGDMIDTLVADIANYDRNNTSFSYLRNFDEYEGHSWAIGYSNFLDGNNHESSSEAINAWYGSWLWSEVRANTELGALSEYLYSAEVNSTKHYWLNWFNNKDIFPVEYARAKASMVWGGKFEYQTWFSTEPQAIEAIQYLPFSAGSLYLYNKAVLTRDANNFSGLLENRNAHLNDMNYMYYAMLKGTEVLPAATIDSLPVDEAQSRAYMYLWSDFWQKVDNVRIVLRNGNPEYEFIPKQAPKPAKSTLTKKT